MLPEVYNFDIDHHFSKQDEDGNTGKPWVKDKYETNKYFNYGFNE